MFAHLEKKSTFVKIRMPPLQNQYEHFFGLVKQPPHIRSRFWYQHKQD
jgi:hypothetical protein